MPGRGIEDDRWEAETDDQPSAVVADISQSPRECADMTLYTVVSEDTGLQ